MSTYRFIGILMVLAAGLLAAGCGMHVTADKVTVEHKISFDIEGMLDYCELACDGSTVCFEDCAGRFIDLLNDPQICAALNSCPNGS